MFCTLDGTKFNRVSVCESAKEVWTILQTTHKGTNKVKKSKTGYELFKRKTRENIIDMYKCFCNLVNDLKGLGILDNQIGDEDFEIIVGSMNNKSHKNWGIEIFKQDGYG